MDGAGLDFTMVSYNVLSQHLLGSMRDLYEGSDPLHTAWETRGPRLWRQVVRLKPDTCHVIQLPPNGIGRRPVGRHVADHAEGGLNTLRCFDAGLQILYKRRTGPDKKDGCALLYREARFELCEEATVEYLQRDCPSLDRDNVGIVARLRSDRGDLVVACTHLLYNPRRHDVKLAQVALLLAEVDRLAWCGRTERHLPVLLAGDFNLEPFSPVSGRRRVLG
ncbi:protein angel homolog 2-like [Pollicipes pollicipes]|uniref:protein angel homolog 2-like n=1 Tax=Pollicipes pollicipes TaxID=41117 RepID=UPI00188510C3|nr:protein angel homolog 2-like [Pollicipes pollicipes]